MYQGDNLAKHMYHLLLKCAIGGWNYDPLRVVFVATFIAAVVTGLPGWPSGSSRWRFLILLLVIGSDADALNKKSDPCIERPQTSNNKDQTEGTYPDEKRCRVRVFGSACWSLFRERSTSATVHFKRDLYGRAGEKRRTRLPSPLRKLPWSRPSQYRSRGAGPDRRNFPVRLEGKNACRDVRANSQHDAAQKCAQS